MSPFKMRPLSLVIAPDLDNPHEFEGFLNPAAARGPDGELYLFPRRVAKGNFSRMGILRVLFDSDGDPCGVERLGIALAVSKDLLTWRRLGLASFVPYNGIEFEGVDNEDATDFPLAVPNPSGRQKLAKLQRPLFPGPAPDELVETDGACIVTSHSNLSHAQPLVSEYKNGDR